MSDKQLKIRIKFHAPSKALLESTPALDKFEQEQAAGQSSKNIISLKLISVVAGFIVLTIAIFVYMLNDNEAPQATIADIGSKSITPGAADGTSVDSAGSSTPSLRLFDPAATTQGSLIGTKNISEADAAALLAKAENTRPTKPPQISLPVLEKSTSGSPASDEKPVGVKPPPADKPLMDIAEIETDSRAQPRQSLPSVSAVHPIDATSDGELSANDSHNPSNAVSNSAALAESAPLGEREPPIQPSSNVARAQFTTGIKAREPIDRIESVVYAEGPQLKRLFYFTELLDLKGETIIHRWEHEGELVAEVKFKVRGNRWRVYSSKYLQPQMTGQWRVIVVNSKGESLAAADFMFEKS